MSTSYLSIQQLVQNLVQLCSNHLIVHNMRKMSRSQNYLLHRRKVIFIVLLKQTHLNIHTSLDPLKEQHLLSRLFKNTALT